ncbi:nuclease domain-containing protein [Neomegalonema sp.]|uniref:nuclease domain-containing protein n=1 Tax=Neomegalonema sp. TaxID=2039713 RepID=UPI002619A556|nr:nuclease domain-containing protein [Neomegalonema sp.]MDD2867788.1 nuclease domain-containing protein [Neomegalonema sp.]
MSAFIIFQGPESLLEVDLPGQERLVSLRLKETQRIGFAVQDPEPGMEVGVWIGDRGLGDLAPGEDARPHRLRRSIEWAESSWLDGANGVTPITLRRLEDKAVLARVNALVEPSKLSQQAYDGMFDAMTRISIELLLDLTSKSRLGLAGRRENPGERKRGAVSARVEANRIRVFWRGFAPLLAQLLAEPVRGTRIDLAVRRLRPGEGVDARVLRRLCAGGRPARQALQAGAPMELPTPSPTMDTREHQAVVGFLDLLRRRTMRSRATTKTEIDMLRDAVALYAGRDLHLHDFVLRRESPRIDRLQTILDQMDALSGEIMRIMREFGGEPRRPGREILLLEALDTPLFRSHPVYSRVALLMRSFLEQTAIVVEQGGAERAKPIETMYEQWVFFQIVAALRAIGLVCVSHRSLFEPIARNRYSVDLDRNASVIFEAADGRRASVRYEPTILPRAAAQGVDTLFRGDSHTPWTPDVVLEIFEAKSGPRDYKLSYAVVIDAKYTHDKNKDRQTRNLERYLEKTERYSSIRDVASGLQIVRQIWIAAPVESMVSPRDETIMWSADGEVDAHPTDQISGWIGVDPATPEETAATMKSFLRGVLNHARDYARSVEADRPS